MKNNFNIDKIRLLLHKFYEGETTPEEEHDVESFFRLTPIEAIPEPMMADRQLFLSISGLRSDSDGSQSPEELEKKLTDIASSSLFSSLKKNRRRWKRHISYAGIAAAICVVISIGLLITPSHNTKTLEEVRHVGNMTEDGYLEITDPEEAERIVNEIGHLLASNSKKTDEAISLVADIFDEYMDISNSDHK